MRTLGSVLPGIAAFEEFGYLAGWLYFNSSTAFGLSMLSAGILFFLSAIWVLFALETAYSKHLVYKGQRLKYLHFFIGLPVLAGSMFILLLHSLNVDFFLQGSGTMPRLGDSTHELIYLAEFGIVYVAMMMFLPFYREREFIIVRDLRMLKPQKAMAPGSHRYGPGFSSLLGQGLVLVGQPAPAVRSHQEDLGTSGDVVRSGIQRSDESDHERCPRTKAPNLAAGPRGNRCPLFGRRP